MINYENIIVSNLFTEGFELSVPSPASIAITEGILSHITKNETRVFTFPAIEFDVEGDAEVAVQYDVYLLSRAGSDGFVVDVNRTEMGGNVVPVYDGDGDLLHALLSFTMPPGTNDLTEIDLIVRNVVLKPQEEENTDETPTEE